MAQLSKMERAFLLGFKHGCRCAATETWRDAEAIINRFKDELQAEILAMRSAFARSQAGESASKAERDESKWLN